MPKKLKLVIAFAAVAIAVFAVARLYFPLVGPRSARELVRTYSNLPVPLLVVAERAKDDPSGYLCQDYYAQGVIRLSQNDCARMIQTAKDAGYRDLPLPTQVKPIQAFDAPAVPSHGVYQYLEKPKEVQFSWIDGDACRMFVEFSIQ